MDLDPCTFRRGFARTGGWLWREFEGNSVVLLTGMVFSEAFVASLVVVCDKFTAACFSSLEPVLS